jgi:hypothetical protein
MIEKDRAARRFLQIAEFEETVRRIESAIEDVQKEIDGATERLSNLRREKRAALEDMRRAARDEGQMPLLPFDIDHALSVARIGVGVLPAEA